LTAKPQVPYSLYVVCPACEEETLHKVLKGKVHAKGLEVRVEATVECTVCSRVHSSKVSETKPLQVPVVVSWKESSERMKIEMAPEDAITVGDVIQHDFPLLVTAVETKVRRERSARARDVVCLWAKRFDKVVVKFSISRGMSASSCSVEVAPDEEFCAQEIVELERGPVFITSIRTTDRNVEKGCVPASEIVRIYAKPVRETTRAYTMPRPQRRPGRRPPSRQQSRPARRGFRPGRR
jgi:uncharacterized Zn finger protein